MKNEVFNDARYVDVQHFIYPQKILTAADGVFKNWLPRLLNVGIEEMKTVDKIRDDTVLSYDDEVTIILSSRSLRSTNGHWFMLYHASKAVVKAFYVQN